MVTSCLQFASRKPSKMILMQVFKDYGLENIELGIITGSLWLCIIISLLTFKHTKRYSLSKTQSGFIKYNLPSNCLCGSKNTSSMLRKLFLKIVCIYVTVLINRNFSPVTYIKARLLKTKAAFCLTRRFPYHFKTIPPLFFPSLWESREDNIKLLFPGN